MALKKKPIFFRSRKARNRKNPLVKEYYKASITERFKRDLIEGAPNAGTSPTRFVLVKYHEDGDVHYYPLRLLFRTTAEQIVNGVVTGQSIPTDETFNTMYDNINALFPNDYIDWFRRDNVVVRDNANDQIYNEEVMRRAGKLMFFPKEDGMYDKDRFMELSPRETLGNMFDIASQLPEGEDRDVWLRAARRLTKVILDVFNSDIPMFDEDFLLHEVN